jgi:hypothetical protein
MTTSPTWFDQEAERFFNSDEWKRSETLLATIGSHTTFEKVLIVSDSAAHRLANQSASETDEHIIVITGTMGVPVKVVLDTYSDLVHLIMPDDHKVVPWDALNDHDGQAIFLA